MDKKNITLSLFPDAKITAIHIPSEVNKKEIHRSQVKWKVKISNQGREIETDYSTGIGHLEKTRNGYLKENCIANVEALEKALRSGDSGYSNTIRYKIKKPPLDDVVYCLVSDSDALMYDTFEEWADSTGYDADSRSAEKIYNACRKIGSDLKKVFGGSEGLQKLQEAFQDY